MKYTPSRGRAGGSAAENAGAPGPGSGRAKAAAGPISDHTRASRPIYGLPHSDIEGFEILEELALDMRWSWNHATDEVWRRLDPVLWDLTHHPWDVLQTVSRQKVQEVLADPDFRRNTESLLKAKRDAAAAPAWFQLRHPQSSLTCAAYFSMEFMLSEAIPIYSGGLGNVAGDQLKAASDLGVPVVGVGLMYQQGYFRQVIDKDGAQQALFPYNDPGQMPVTPLRRPDGEWLRLEMAFPGGSVWLRAWQVQVGRVKLLLLDSNDAATPPAYRGITSELYGGGPELRIMQELVLGIGGWRLLRAAGFRPEICHLNEGHAAFAVLERARDFMRETSRSFEVALAVTRAGNLFTTHTAVDAGFDRFASGLVAQYLRAYAATELGIALDDLLGLGRRDPADREETFNMAYLAIRGSGSVNGVSRLHAEVSRRLFEPLFPRWPAAEIPVGHVTNGVHMPTWDSATADELWTSNCGKERWLGTTEAMEANMRRVCDADIWNARLSASRSFVEYVRDRLSHQLTGSGALPESAAEAGRVFDPEALTIGFARRFASYKRPNLLLHDPERLVRLLTDPNRPVQLVVAGKAHPADQEGQDLIREWTRFVRRPEVRRHAVFIADYNMLLSEYLVQGVDVWINTPRRPWEACGTSGMKVLVNGGLNLSELDGWWAEAYAPDVGWALGDGREHDHDAAWDAAEADELYRLLEREVIPEFFTRNGNGIPTAWVGRMRESMARLTPRFSADRAVREYTVRHYLPAAVAFQRRSANGGAAGLRMVERRRATEGGWEALRFGGMSVERRGDSHVFDVEVHLGGLEPRDVRVELYADGADGRSSVREEMKPVPTRGDSGGKQVFRAAVPAARPAADYTARVVPRSDGLAVPLEDARIKWQR